MTLCLFELVCSGLNNLGIPLTDKWVPVQIYKILGTLINRISNRIFLGKDDCNNMKWCEASIAYSENVTLTVMIIRCFPLWLRSFAAYLVPSAWRLQSNLRAAKKALVPVINRRREAAKKPGYEKPNDFLQWMMDAANEEEGRPEKLAHRQLILILASVHTTTMTGAHAFYDLCAHPEYFEPLREEIADVLREEGGWQKTTLTKLQRLDSFLKESQRMNPASLCEHFICLHLCSMLMDDPMANSSVHSGVPPHRPNAIDTVRWYTSRTWYSSLRCLGSYLQGS
jgi:hypothetical protein